MKKKIRSIEEITKSREVRDKGEYYLLYNHGLLGNKVRTWSSYQEILESGWKDNICIRGRKGIKRGMVVYNIPIKEVSNVIKKWKKQGISESSIRFNQSMPDEDLVIQGEVMRTFLGLSLWYTTEKVPMNKALEIESLYAEGLKAKLLLENNMDASSYADLEALMEIFPNSAIEFSSYRIPIGNIKGRNTVIWEVRNY